VRSSRSDASDAALLAALLVVTAGYVDGYGLFTFGTFLSFMSGNTTLAGYSLGQGKFVAAVFPFLAVVGFVCGATIGAAFTRTRLDHARRFVVSVVAGAQISMILAAHFDWPARPVRVAVMSAAMGILNHAVTQVGAEQVNLTFITGTLIQLGDTLAQALARAPIEGARGTSLRSAAELATLWVSFFTGALLAGLAVPRLGTWALAPSATALAVIAVVLPRSAGD